jgi:hypothetical protein
MLGLAGAQSYWQAVHPLRAEDLILNLTLPGMISVFVVNLGSGFFGLLARPAFVDAAASLFHGRQTSIRAAMSAIGNRWKSLLALNLAERIVVIVAPGLTFIGLTFAAAALADSGGGDAAVTIVAYTIFTGAAGILLAYFVWIASCLALSFPSLVVEGGSWLGAIKRSWRLSRGTRGRIVLTGVLVPVGSWGLSLLTEWSLYFIFRALPRGGFMLHSVFAYRSVYLLGKTVVYALVFPVYPIALTLFYYDQRIRLEGYDIECMMQAAGLDKAAEGKCGSFDSLRFAPVAQDDSVNEEGAA